MSAFFRRRVEQTIEDMIALLDDLDGDADLEPDCEDEDNHDREADPAEAGVADTAALGFVLAEVDRRSRLHRK